MMRTLVVGAGATGGYYGTRLAQAGRDVTFLVRAHRARTLRDRGLRLHTPTGTERIEPELVEAAEITTPFDLVLLTVKATAVDEAVKDLAAAVGSDTLIVPVLNGLDHYAVLDAAFGMRSVLGGVAKVVTSLTDDGDIRQFAPGASLVIGVRDPATDADRFDRAAATLDVEGIELATSDTIDADLWQKWVFIAGIGAATTLLGGAAGQIASVDGGSEVATAVIEEAASVAAAAGFPTDGRPIAAPFADPDSPLTSSLYRDMIGGRPTEVEPVLGDLVRRGRKLGVALPLLTAAAVRLRVLNQTLA